MRIVLLDYLEDAEEILAAGAYATRSRKSAADIKPTEKQVKDMIKWTKKYKLSSVLDFPWYIFVIEGVSRVFTHQWVRYRLAAHMQQSLRYVKVDVKSADWFVIPPSVTEKGAEAVIEYVKAHLRAGEIYQKLLDSGIPPEDARFVLPHSVKTHISSAFDAEEMIHIIYQRTCYEAQWEIRTVAYAVLFAGMVVHPDIFGDVGPPCVFEGVCRSARKWSCFEDVKRIIDALKKRREEVTNEFESLRRGEFLRVDLTDILGYRAPPEVANEVEKALGIPVKLDIEVIVEVRKK